MFRRLEEVFLSRCRQFGYREIKTATIEPLFIFTGLGALGDNRVRRIYSFMDWDGWSGERVALKPDSTTCVARFYGDHCLKDAPKQKLCYVENHFEWADTWDHISERWQCGVENIGDRGPESDVEIIFMARDVLKEIGLKDFRIYLSFPSLILDLQDAGILGKEASGIFPENPAGKDFHKSDYLKNILHLMPDSLSSSCRKRFEDFIFICTGLDALGCDYRVDFSLQSDFAYYTGIKFQIFSGAKRRSGKDILCAGGRYDHFIREMWNLDRDIPAVGFALYMRNIMHRDAFQNHAASRLDKLQNISICIGSITSGNVKTAQMLSDRLMGLGFMGSITFVPVKPENYAEYGLVIEVDHEKFDDGYRVLYSQKIGKPLLTNLFGDFHGR